MTQQPLPIAVPAAWNVLSFRLTAFASPNEPFQAVEWWEKIVGEPPENYIKRPKDGLNQEDGPLGSGRLLVGVQRNRIDWIFKTIEGPTGLGEFSEVLILFKTLMAKWLTTAPNIIRLAFGSVMLQQVPDSISGHRLISRYLPLIHFNIDHTSDLLYQINHPRNSTSGLEGLIVNRLSKWSVVKLLLESMQIAPGVSMLESSSVEELWACQLELDVSTSQDYKVPLPATRIQQIFQELVDLGGEIVREGDVI